MRFVLGISVAAYLAVEYILVAILWRLLEGQAFGWDMVAVWVALGVGACLLAELGERILRRRGRPEGAFLVLAPGPLAGAVLAFLAQDGLREPTLGISVAWPHAVALLIVLQRTNLPGETFADAPLLRRLLRALLLLGAGAFAALVLFLWRSPATGFHATVNLMLTSWLGVGLVWAVLHEVVDRTPALTLMARVRSALGAEPLSRRPRLAQMRRELGLSGTLNIPTDFPETLAQATFDDPALAKASFDLLADIRRTTARGPTPNRALLWECISAQRRLGASAMADMLRGLDDLSQLERVLVVKAFLLMPPSDESKAEMDASRLHVDERLANELWLYFQYEPAVAAHVMNAVTALRHNIIKHQYANLPTQPRGSATSRERIARVIPAELSPGESEVALQIIRQLAPILRQLGETTMAEEIAEAESLALAPVLGREQFLHLDDLVERVRTMADEIRRLLRVNLADWLSVVLRLRHDLHPEVSFKFECDSALRGSLTLVAPRDWLEQMFGSLLDNAARAAQAGATVRPATVQVEAYLVGDPRAPTVQVAVSDSGAGMPAEERRRIWETAGTGLQLVLQTVHRLHGEARVEDSALGGLKLLLDIPRNPG